METSVPPGTPAGSTGLPARRRRFALGIIAQGQIAVGIVAIGGVSVGVVALGGVAIGVIALGGLAIGGLALGGITFGWRAIGALSFGLALAQGAIKLILASACPGVPRRPGEATARKSASRG